MSDNSSEPLRTEINRLKDQLDRLALANSIEAILKNGFQEISRELAPLRDLMPEYGAVPADETVLSRESEPPSSGFLGEVLDALKPLQALRPPYGELPEIDAKRFPPLGRIAAVLEHEAHRFQCIADALRRPDLSKA